jgi:hypothetical protein
MKSVFVLTFFSALLVGCVSNGPHSGFVKTTTFSALQTFSYKHTLVTGMDFRDSEERLLENLSEESLVEAFAKRGFEQVETGSDFFVVAKWRKEVSSYPSMFDSIDGPQDSLNRRDHPSYRFASRLHLTVEIYESDSREMFWREELPNIFDATQFTEERVIAALQRAVEDFPDRVEKDPNLPNIE